VANPIVRFILFISSYAPLLLILAIRNYAAHPRWGLGLVALASLSALGLFLYLRSCQRLASYPIVIKTVTSKDGDAMSYIITYLFPFLDAPLTDTGKLLSWTVMIVVIGLLYVNSNMIHTNPLLNAAGYHIFAVESSDGKSSALVCRRQYLPVGTEVTVVPLGDYVVLEKRP
jgi:hypothetical protein